MLQMLRKRIKDEEGFTLVELLVVVLIIGILAAIALPTFLGQTQRAQDASAKSNARNAVSQMESCFTTNQDYTPCTTANTLATAGLPASVTVGGQNANSYVITATGTNGQVFTITKAGGGAPTRTCVAVGVGGCPANGSW